MNTLTKKKISTKRGFEYTYFVSSAAAGKPTVLLQHGFPDEAAMWEGFIVNHLRPAGYGVIAPDLLGYGGTSKPTNPAVYKYADLASDIVEIIDAEKVDKVISMGHDWGSINAQRLYNFHPERVAGLIIANVAYTPATKQPFDLDAHIALTEKTYGYGTYWYWKFFTADDGAKILNQNVDILFDLLHDPDSWKATFCTKDGMRNALLNRGEGFNFKRRAYATEELKEAFVERMERDGFEAPMCCYKSHAFGYQIDEPSPGGEVVNVPTLFLGYDKDPPCRPEDIIPAMEQGLLPQFTRVTLEGGHWGLLEFPDEFGKNVTQWLESNKFAK
ncbi:hypothetical protein DHEL01_v210238 [Diaporthe helianthi]|uniref:AB hydrolase-1 domain-containing protein n=1 Tax=Diaporthe helianthi TaxID=158607 RepID=A0A2P5HM91_DIAHE|nr:hypothetical protein DHEL01_v210238 [Diaporthe helianthi]